MGGKFSSDNQPDKRNQKPPPNPTGRIQPPQVLSRFRQVIAGSPTKDTASHKPLRKLLNENPKEFFAQLNRLEEEFRVDRQAREKERNRALPEESESGPEVDAGLEAVDELITKLLDEWDGPTPNVGS